MFGKKVKIILAAGLTLSLAAGLAVPLGLARNAAAEDTNTVVSVKTDFAPAIDGVIESGWSKASAITIPVAGGQNLPDGKSEVTLKSVYTDDMVYFLAQWKDPSKSERRMPWQKQADGTWKKLKTTNEDENTYYEDKFAMLWDINGIQGFDQQGCAVACHLGEGKPFGNKYAPNQGELGDIWHLKSVRTAPVGQFDDQYLDSTRYDPANSPEAGRKSDPKTSGGYKNNENADKTAPGFTAADQPAPPYWILDSQKQPFADTYNAGDEIASILIAPFTGDRGDIPAKLVWNDGVYTAEFARKLNTGSQFDVQFSDLTKTYHFGTAVFDNAQVRHAVATTAYHLKFQPSSGGAAANVPSSALAPVAAFQSTGDRWYFAETGHSLSFGFLNHWLANGGLGAFGYPLTEEFTAVSPTDGKTYTMQVFERARFEYHADLAGTPFEVQLGLLGAEALK